MKKALKSIAALIAAAVILDLFCAWYYNPADYLWDEARATDRIRRPNAVTSRAKEGFSICRIDENGYNNPSAPDQVDILMMGTSHTEGFNVAPEDNTTARLGSLMPEKSVYNIGMSSHTLMRNVINLDRALDRFAPTDCVILETTHVAFERWETEAALNEDLDRLEPTDLPLPRWLSDRPLVRTLAQQYLNLKNGGTDSEVDVAAAPAAQDQYAPELLEEYHTELCKIFSRVKASADAHGVDVIIYYQPSLTLHTDGTATDDTNIQVRETFAAACGDCGITFIDMGVEFLRAYEEDHVLPHGFINTAPEYGHLNKDGCRVVAETLRDALTEAEVNT